MKRWSRSCRLPMRRNISPLPAPIISGRPWRRRQLRPLGNAEGDGLLPGLRTYREITGSAGSEADLVMAGEGPPSTPCSAWYAFAHHDVVPTAVLPTCCFNAYGPTRGMTHDGVKWADLQAIIFLRILIAADSRRALPRYPR